MIFAQMGMMQAIHRHHKRVFNPDGSLPQNTRREAGTAATKNGPSGGMAGAVLGSVRSPDIEAPDCSDCSNSSKGRTFLVS